MSGFDNLAKTVKSISRQKRKKSENSFVPTFLGHFLSDFARLN
jgi:hypothetical protein